MPLKEVLRKWYVKVFPNYYAELEKAVGKCKTLLDLGCGPQSPIEFFSKNLYSVGVDAFAPSIEESKKRNIHNKYLQIDVFDVEKEIKPGSFDCVVASDFIEHFTKEEGARLIAIMERIAGEKVIIFTPSGFFPQGEYGDNPLQAHKSGWSPGDLRNRGYRVIGINGWKPLRGELAEVKHRPRALWIFISDLTQIFVRNRPEKAFQILAVKSKER